MQKQFLWIFLIGSCALFPACSRKTPADLPELVPLTVTVTQEGQPLQGANVMLVPTEEADQKWNALGETNESGSVALSTHGLYPGVKPGKFKVMLYKVETVTPKIPDDPAAQEAIERGTMSLPAPQAYDLIDPQFGKPSTPLEIEVSETTSELTLDAGKPVKILK
ncbi:MAG: hypothetical protein Q4G68_14870 [Planctomycetia bacterium]|nr:hypothetical protein [Planctomycetia bacterium]